MVVKVILVLNGSLTVSGIENEGCHGSQGQQGHRSIHDILALTSASGFWKASERDHNGLDILCGYASLSLGVSQPAVMA